MYSGVFSPYTVTPPPQITLSQEKGMYSGNFPPYTAFPSPQATLSQEKGMYSGNSPPYTAFPPNHQEYTYVVDRVSP